MILKKNFQRILIPFTKEIVLRKNLFELIQINFKNAQFKYNFIHEIKKLFYLNYPNSHEGIKKIELFKIHTKNDSG